MKNYIVFTVLCLFSIHLNAQQQYKRCLDDGVVKWSVLSEFVDVGKVSYDYVADGDTIINDVSYKNMYEIVRFEYEESNTNWKNNIYLSGDCVRLEHDYIRESEDASRLYILNIYSSKEYLISDLNLQVGDEFEIPEIWYDFIGHGSKDYLTVDSVYTKDGLKHVQLDYELGNPGTNDRYKITFIEGIGSNGGFFPTTFSFGWQILNCFQNQSLFYQNETISYPCGYWVNGSAIKTILSNKNYTIKIQDNSIDIHFFTDENLQISFCDVSGRLYYQQDFLRETNASIPTSSFPKGIYLLTIVDKNKNQRTVSKIIL